jgi:protein involved in polysaccharide export with SLBB domain
MGLVCAMMGCAAGRTHLDEKLMAKANGPERNSHVSDCYVVRCPDVIQVRIAGAGDLSRQLEVQPTGCIALPTGDSVRVDGQTLPEIERRIGAAIGLRADYVDATMVEYRSQHVYLFGPGIGVQRAVSYQGPETVLDLLQRVGGVTPGTAAQKAYIVRPRVLDDRAPEVFPIDLRAIVLGNDMRTNIRLQPFDHVYVGETRQASMQKCVPPCFRPLYEVACGLAR